MPDTTPKITVLMTVFNGERYLSEAMNSVLSQTMPEFELIVVDDMSTDRSAEMLSDYAARDARVRVLQNAENSGPYPSANNGLDQARAPLIARMDADDICEPDRLERQLEFMQLHSDCLLVGSGYRSIDGESKHRFLRQNPMDFQTCAFVTRLRMPMVHPSFCFRAELPNGSPVRYDESVPIAGDYALAAKLASVGKVASLDAILVKYRMHADNISSTKLDRQRHFAHATSTAAVAAHYPHHIAADLTVLLDVLYHKEGPTSSRLERAVKGLDAAITHDCADQKSTAIEERAAGILAEAFAKDELMAFLTKAPKHLVPLAKRFARLKNILPQLSG